ncbi:MAG: hypothetical protein LW809_05185 [Vampirovibrionales bacterium]|jgi:hypothetical protein|nr:hypothetical protein [Vampirovibrionales bacterium]
MGLATASFMNQLSMMQTMNAQYSLMNGAQAMIGLTNQASNLAMSNPNAIDGGYGQGGYMNNLFQTERALMLNQSRQQMNLKMYEAMQESSQKLVDKKAGQVGKYLDVSG